MTKPLRQTMPAVAAWVDDLRAAFGRASVDAAIRAGLDGQPTFYATENGHTVGTPAKPPQGSLTAAQFVALGRTCPYATATEK